MKFPSAYRYAKTDPDFFWIRKDIPNGDMNITIYEVPYNMIDADSNTIGSLIKMRDSIAGDNIVVNEGMRFITEAAFAPYLNETTIDGKKAFEMKGMWEVKGRFMAGPFVNYTVDDKENNRYLVLEGFVFKPSAKLNVLLEHKGCVAPMRSARRCGCAWYAALIEVTEHVQQ